MCSHTSLQTKSPWEISISELSTANNLLQRAHRPPVIYTIKDVFEFPVLQQRMAVQDNRVVALVGARARKNLECKNQAPFPFKIIHFSRPHTFFINESFCKQTNALPFSLGVTKQFQEISYTWHSHKIPHFGFFFLHHPL